MQEKLQNFAQLPVHRVTDSCIVALLSHGVEGGVYGVDGKLLQVRAGLWLRLLSLGHATSRCPSLQGRPLFMSTGLGSHWPPTSSSPLFLSNSYKRFFGSLTMPTAQAYRTNRKCSSSRPAVEVSAPADRPLGVAPGQPPPALTFLFAPLRC